MHTRDFRFVLSADINPRVLTVEARVLAGGMTHRNLTEGLWCARSVVAASTVMRYTTMKQPTLGVAQRCSLKKMYYE